MGKQFRYDGCHGIWHKGNTHLHSTCSDGGQTPDKLATMYKNAGYSFIFYTDHWHNSQAENLSSPDDFLLMDGIEIDGTDNNGSYYHVISLGQTGDLLKLRQQNGTIDPILQYLHDQGNLLIMAHPLWCGNSYDDGNRHVFDGVEIYNHVTHWLNGKSDGCGHWHHMLSQNHNTLSFAVDDAHILPEHPGWNGGWIKVNLSRLDQDDLMEALRRGHFFSSTGPDFHSIDLINDRIKVRTDPVQHIRLVGPASHGRRIGSYGDKTISEAEFTLPNDWPWAYLEIEDERGRRAWSNSLMV